MMIIDLEIAVRRPVSGSGFVEVQFAGLAEGFVEQD
jgi:hypothetical protein